MDEKVDQIGQLIAKFNAYNVEVATDFQFLMGKIDELTKAIKEIPFNIDPRIAQLMTDIDVATAKIHASVSAVIDQTTSEPTEPTPVTPVPVEPNPTPAEPQPPVTDTPVDNTNPTDENSDTKPDAPPANPDSTPETPQETQP